MKIIEEAEALCAKAIDQVSQTWESLIEDIELQKFADEIGRTDTKVTQLKNDMKQLPLAQKMAKVTKMKKLQQSDGVAHATTTKGR